MLFNDADVFRATADQVIHTETEQDAQLSQRDHTTGCIIVLAKSGKL